MSRAKLLLAAVVLGSTLTVGCTGSTTVNSSGGSSASAGMMPAQPADALVGAKLATVNGYPVGALAFDSLAQRKTPADGKAFSAAEKKEVMDQAITDELLFQEAFKRGLYHDGKVRKILVNLLLRSEVYDSVKNEDFTDEQLQAYYEAHKEDFVVPEKIQVKRIFLQVKPDRDQAATDKLAAELIATIKRDPETFGDLAVQHSGDPFARRGGDLGYLGREGKPGVPPELIDRAFALPVGTVSDPIQASGGVNILFVANKRERLERTFEQMRGSVLRRAKNDKYEELSKTFIEKLKATAGISLDEAALAAYNPAPPSRPSIPDGMNIEGAGEAGAPVLQLAPGMAPGEPGDPNQEIHKRMQQLEQATKGEE